MKITRSKRWWLKKADSEGDTPIGAGVDTRRYKILTKHGDAVPGFEDIGADNPTFLGFIPDKPLFMLGVGQSVVAHSADDDTLWVEVERTK